MTGIQEFSSSPITDMNSTVNFSEPNEIHTPVMLERCVDLLEPAILSRKAVVIDATLGMGGHTARMLQRFPDLTVIGLDRDTEALKIASQRLAVFGNRFHPVHTVFDGIGEVLVNEGISHVDGVLFDLGVSSLQLDEAERGFAYAQDAPLDMRMDQTSDESAAELIARIDEQELRQLIREYGDEPLAGRYAAAIVRAREETAITRSGQLVDILQDATPAKIKNQRHPAKRVFQALRVAVNDELAAVKTAIPQALDALRVGGRIVIMAYQSHEDRIVKRTLVTASTSTAPTGLPVELPEHLPQFKLLTRGAERASEEEQQSNPRSIPARLRAAERMREAV